VRLAEGVAIPPPAHLKARVMETISQTPQLRPQLDVAPPAAPVIELAGHRRRTRTMQVLAAAAAIAIVAVGAVVLIGSRGGSGVDDVLAAPDAMSTTLAGDGGNVQVVWSPGRDQVALIGSGLPPAAPGYVFELWAIADGTPIPAGLFTTSGDGSISAIADVGDFEPEAWGITIEPTGGSLQPTSDIIYYAET
jgi:anti-sigma-K factor RskA